MFKSDAEIDTFLDSPSLSDDDIDAFLDDKPQSGGILNTLKQAGKAAVYGFGEASGGALEGLVSTPTEREKLAADLRNAGDSKVRQADSLIKTFSQPLNVAKMVGEELVGAFDKATGLDKPKAAVKQTLKDLGVSSYEYWNAKANQAEKDAKLDPYGPAWWTFQTARVMGDMAPMMATALATKSPNAGLGVMGAQVFGRSFGQAIEEGKDDVEATRRAIFDVAAEVIPERIPLGILTKEGTKFFSRVMKSAGAEGAQELFTEVLQAGYDYGIIDPQTSWGEAAPKLKAAWESGELPTRLAVAPALGAMAGGGLAVASHPFVGGEQTDQEQPTDTRSLEDLTAEEPTAAEPAPPPVASGIQFAPPDAPPIAKPMVQLVQEKLASRSPEAQLYQQAGMVSPYPGGVNFKPPQTALETPEQEAARLAASQEQGLPYAPPSVAMESPVDEATRTGMSVENLPVETVAAQDIVPAPGIDVQDIPVPPAELMALMPQEPVSIPPVGVQTEGIDVGEADTGDFIRRMAKDRGTEELTIPPVTELDRELIAELRRVEKERQDGETLQAAPETQIAFEPIKGNRFVVKTDNPNAVKKLRALKGAIVSKTAGGVVIPAAQRQAAEALLGQKPQVFDPRLSQDRYKQALQGMAGQAVKGGGVAYIRDERGDIVGRTASLNPAFIQGMIADRTIGSVKEFKALVEKAVNGEKLTPRQQGVITQLLDMEDMEAEAAQLEDRFQEYAASRTEPEPVEGFGEPEYTLDELVSRASRVDEDAAMSILERGGSEEGEVARREEVAALPRAEPVTAEASKSEGKFSLAEKQPRLSALHNLNAENLAYADKMGGLAVPSIGVVKEGMGIKGMGDITLIGGKGLADPEVNPVHDADVYSPTFPRPSYDKVRTVVAQKMVDAIRPFADRFDDYTAHQVTWDNAVNNPRPEEIVSAWMRGPAAKAMFLAEKGISVEPAMKAQSVEFPWAADKKFIAAYKRLSEIIDNYPPDQRADNPELLELSDEARAAIDRYIASHPKEVKKLSEVYGDQALREHYGTRFGSSGEWVTSGEPMSWGTMMQIGDKSINRLGKKEVDHGVTDGRLNKAMRGMEAEFKNWVDDKVMSMFGAPFLKTRSGRLPYTLSSIVDVMSGKVRAQEDTLTYGEGKARAAAAKQFRDLEQMRRYASSIADEETINRDRERAKKLLSEWRDGVVNYYGEKIEGGNAFGRVWDGLDASMRAIARWARGGKTAENMRRALAAEGFRTSDMPSQYFEDGVEAGLAFLRAPVPYFESKPQRAVSLNEFAGAVIPAKSSPETRAILDKHGIPYIEYKGGPEEQQKAADKFRKRLAGKGEDVLFSLENPAPRADTSRTEITSDDQAIERFRDSLQAVGIPREAVAAGNLRPDSARSISQLGELIGRRIVVFRNTDPAKFNASGFVHNADNSVIYLDQNASRNYLAIVGHEFTHTLKSEHPDLYRQFLRETVDVLNAKELEAMIGKLEKRRASYGLKPLPRQTAIEEAVADFFGDQFMDRKFWEETAARNPSMMQRIARAFADWINAMIAKVRRGNDTGKLFFDLQKARAAAASVLAEHMQRTPSKAETEGGKFSLAPKDQTQTPAFKRWFKDSKVVDAQGRPLVVYHGTSTPSFTVFKRQRGGWSGGFGIWFGSAPSIANEFAKPRFADQGPAIYAVYLSVQNPKIYNGWTEFTEAARATGKADIGDMQKSLRNRLIRAGYDGVVIRGSDTDNGGTRDDWVAFESTQIKSATGNTGAFDPNNPDIRFSLEERRDAVGRAGEERQADPFFEENRRLREEDQTVWKRAKTYWRRQFLPGGLLPHEVFKEDVQRNNELQVVEFDISHLVATLEHAVKQDYGKAMNDLPAAQVETLAKAMSGAVDPQIPENTRTAVVAMRQYVDSLSRQYADMLERQVAELQVEGSPEAQVKAQLLETIRGNIGQYVHRSYKAFDDPQWFKKVQTETVNAARRYLMDRYAEEGVEAAEARRLADVTINEILKNGTAYDSMESFIKESKLGAKDLSVLKRRQSIPVEIRALLGEYRDPRVNFAKSASKMSRLVWNQKFLDRVRDMGMDVFLFEGKNRPANATKQLAADGSEVYSPLNGLWTFPEIEQAFKDALGKERMADWYRTIVRLNGMVKYGKTVLSPTTAFRNWQSAMFFALANGHFNLLHASKSVAGLREYFTHRGSGERLVYLRKLKRLGVVFDTAQAGEMMKMLEDAKIEDLLKGKSGKLISSVRAANDFARRSYQYGDDFFKIIGFENEKASLRSAGMTEAEAETEAAERIRNTYPTYSMVGRGIKSLARFPLVGTFVSFPAEIIRTSGNMLYYVAKDFKTPGMRGLAVKRALGLAMVAGFAHALQAISMAWLGMDDDEEEAIRLMGAPWSRNANFLFSGRDEKGSIQYYDLSFLDPYGYWKKPVTAILRDQPWENKAADVFSEMLSPFLGTDIAAQAIGEVLANKKESGGQVYDRFSSPDKIATDITTHLTKALRPGFVSNMERTYKAMKHERSASGKQYNLQDEGAAWLGWRATTLEPKTALYYRSFDFGDAKEAAMTGLKKKLGSPNEVSDREIEGSFKAAEREYQRAYRDMILVIGAARKNGMDDSEIRRILKTSGISKKDVAKLLRGEIPELEVSGRVQSNAVNKAKSLYGEEDAAKIKARYEKVEALQR